MPTYEYICENCGHKFERFQSITSRQLRKCPMCGEKSLKQLIGAGSGVIFKGPGFYQTDYRSESYKKAEKSEKKDRSTKTEDSKPAQKTKTDKKDKKKSS